ncbi:hypothetical protein RvY_09813 [Ramazzottius varieornatus]|uniref:Uncharacterized protein n=1 Tax=Ramazzottius varieornatus TaxID=947166 RepID=A0A1D1VAM9_RAMVA|nr:hypothetical protein RvY_09813 [Ramazzottius varieornatus]
MTMDSSLSRATSGGHSTTYASTTACWRQSFLLTLDHYAKFGYVKHNVFFVCRYGLDSGGLSV